VARGAARGVKQWDSERGWLENHIYPKIGHLENPVLKVKVPPSAYVEKPRVILTDDEVTVFWSCEDAELEIRTLGLVARCGGGMRTRDCTAWDWTMIDRERFASCIVPRTKTAKPQRLDIPDVLQIPLPMWWVKQEGPTSGSASQRQLCLNPPAEVLPWVLPQLRGGG